MCDVREKEGEEMGRNKFPAMRTKWECGKCGAVLWRLKRQRIEDEVVLGCMCCGFRIREDAWEEFMYEDEEGGQDGT